jgi:hypothetical protein
MPRFAAALALLCAAWVGAPAAAQPAFGPTASLTDLRVGVHPDHTRIVIETDSKAPYVMEPGDDEVVLRVDAAAAAEAVTAKSPDLLWVKVEPTAAGADVRIQLKRPVDVKPMVLTRPDRIVLDLYARTEPAEATPLPAPVLLPEEAEEPLALEMPEPEVPVAEEAEAPLPDFELAEEAPAVAPMPGDVAEPEVERAEAPTTPAAPAPSIRPYLYGATALVLAVVFVWMRRRLRAEKKPVLPPLPEEEEAAPFAPPEHALAVEEEAGTGESVFDVEPDSLQPEAEAAPSLRTPLPEAESADPGERRIAHLEKRVEELSEVKDRLERQIAAQTEELRVQRAAIARTQRVLRSIAPKDEDGSEPLVRG